MSHSFSNNFVHLVYSTKDREELIPESLEPRLYSYIAEVARQDHIPLLAAGGTPNHSHLLLLLPATMRLSDAVSSLKANSSRFLSEQGIDFKWQKGYAAFSVSPSSVKQVKTYIRNQKEHHKRRSFEDEFIDMLKKAGVDYDPRYVFA